MKRSLPPISPHLRSWRDRRRSLGVSAVTLVLVHAALFSGHPTPSVAGDALSGSALDCACNAFADKAMKKVAAWTNSDCEKKLGMTTQAFTNSREYYVNRCKNSLGTSIDADLAGMDDLLRQCGPAPGEPGRPPATPPANPPARRCTSGKWSLDVVNSANGARSQQTYYMVNGMSGTISATNTVPGNPSFGGKVSGSTFQGTMTDATGYRATFSGAPTRDACVWQGSGSDNRGRRFTWSLSWKSP